MTSVTQQGSGAQGHEPQGGARAAAGEAGTQAGELASTAKDSAASVAHAAAGEARSVFDEATGRAKDLASDATRELRLKADEEAVRVAGGLHDFGRQLRSMADAGERGLLTDLVRDGADRAERFAGRLDDGGLDGVLDDARRFARSRPGLFLLGAAAAGVVAGRVARNSDRQALAQAARPGQPASQQPLGQQQQPGYVDLRREQESSVVGGSKRAAAAGDELAAEAGNLERPVQAPGR